MTPDKLPVDVRKNIWAEAERYAEEKVKAVNEEHFNVYNAHIAGATAWAGWKVKHDELQAQAQCMADALEWIKTYGPVDDRTVKFIDKSLQQWNDGKGKDRPCPHCGKELIRDRKLCCRECGKEVENDA